MNGKRLQGNGYFRLTESNTCSRNISKKVLLFVIVNNDNRTPFKQLTELLQTNIEHIWRTIQPAGSESIYDYFVLEFHSLPHYVRSPLSRLSIRNLVFSDLLVDLYARGVRHSSNLT